MKRSYGKRQTGKIAANEIDGAAYVRDYLIQLYDRKDGEAADWPLIAQTLFKAAFSTLDRVSGEKERLAILRRVEAGAYNRLCPPLVDDGE